MNTHASPIIGVIERLEGAEPALFLGDNATQVRRAAARFFIGILDEIEYIDHEWIAAHPEPDLDDANAVEAWLRELSDSSTDALFTLYEASTVHLDSRHYLDTRQH